MKTFRLLAVSLCALALQARMGAELAPEHKWHADYNMEYGGVRSGGDQILDGMYQFKYTWRFGILNDPQGPLNDATISVNTPLGGLMPGQPGDVTLTQGPGSYSWTKAVVSPVPQPGNSYFTQLSSNINVPILYQLGYDVTRDMVGGRFVPANATVTKAFNMTVTAYDPSIETVGVTINFSGVGPTGPVTASSPVCTGPELTEHMPGEMVRWQLGRVHGGPALVTGTQYSLACSVTLTNTSLTPANYSPNVVISGQRTALPQFSGDSASYTSPGLLVDPPDPLGTTAFTSTTTPTTAQLDVKFTRTCHFDGENALIDVMAPVTTWSLPPAPPGGIYNAPSLNVFLSATDQMPGSGVRQITYSMAGAQTQPPTTITGSTANVVVNQQGITTVSVFAEDRAGNIEMVKSFSLAIDRSAPMTTATVFPAPNPAGWITTAASVTLNAADIGVAGVREIRYSVIPPGLPGPPLTIAPGNTVTVGVAFQGMSTVRYSAVDNANNSEFFTNMPVRIDSIAPTATATTSTSPAGVTVNLSGSDVCPQCSGQKQIWYSVSGAQTAPLTAVPGFSASVLISAFGTTTVTFYSEDQAGNLGAPQTRVVTRVPPNYPPVCSVATPSVSRIWPPNHKMVTISINGVTDADGDPVTIRIVSIFQDEATNTNGDGNTEIDGAGIGTSTAQVRAERAGDGDGRVYHITFTASDGKGGSCTGTVRVGVPHDGSGAPAVDGGALFDSTVTGPGVYPV